MTLLGLPSPIIPIGGGTLAETTTSVLDDYTWLSFLLLEEVATKEADVTISLLFCASILAEDIALVATSNLASNARVKTSCVVSNTEGLALIGFLDFSFQTCLSLGFTLGQAFLE